MVQMSAAQNHLFHCLFVIVTVLPWFLEADEAGQLLSFDNRPMGSEQQPLVLRSYFPNPGLDEVVLQRHGRGNATPRYSARTGLLSDKSTDKAIPGIPAAIGVNLGKRLSYTWDTTECRVLYAWVDGFVDMESYWGSADRGSRKKNDYVPRLVGQLFFKAKGVHPLRINGAAVDLDKLRYLSHSRKTGNPVFTYSVGDRQITTSIQAGEAPQTMVISYSSSNTKDVLEFEAPETAFEMVESSESGSLRVLLRPNAAQTFTGFKQTVIKITKANAKDGEKLFQKYGCAACHTTDGSRNHGPSLGGLAGQVRSFEGQSVTADAEYLRESIREPNAKQVPDYPVGMMPKYPLSDLQVDSLVLYIQSLK